MKRLLLASLILLAAPVLGQNRNPLTRGLADALYVKLVGGNTVSGLSTFTNLTVTGTCTGCSSGTAWGSITGTLSSQTDLQNALNLKAPLASPTFTTPTLGDATATSIVASGTLSGLTVTSTGGVLNAGAANTAGLLRIFNASGIRFLTISASVPSASNRTIDIDWSALSATRTLTLPDGNVSLAPLVTPTGSGNAVLATSPTIVTPTIASFASATHNHQNAAGGGTLVDAAIAFTAPALGAPTATTLQTSGNVGLGVAPSGTTGLWLTSGSSANQNDKIQVNNTNNSGTSALAQVASISDSATGSLVANGTGRVVSRWGQAVGGWVELLATVGSGMAIGTTGAFPVYIGTSGTRAVGIDSSQNTTFSGAIIPSQTIGITGTTTNNNANTGAVGEYVTGAVAAATTSLSTGAAINVGTNTNITLTAGDWDCTGAVNFTFGATTSVSNLAGGVSTTTGTLPAQDSYFDSAVAAMVPTSANVATFPVPTVRLSLSGSTSVFLVAKATFTISTATVGGTIRCRRMR